MPRSCISLLLQVEVIRFDTDAGSVGKVLCTRAKTLDAVAIVMAR